MDSRTNDLLREIAKRLEERADARQPAYWTPQRLAGLLDGSALDARGVSGLVRLLVGDVPRFLPVIEGLLGEAARDSDEFAETLEVLELVTGGDSAAEAIESAVLSIGASDPGRALRIAGRLLERGRGGYPDLLIGGAAAERPGECRALARKLVSSGDAEIADAFVEVYAGDPRRCAGGAGSPAADPALLLADKISTSPPFAENVSLRLLAACSKFSDAGVTRGVHRALHRLAGGHLARVTRIVRRYLVGGLCTNDTEAVLEELGRAHGARAVSALTGASMKGSEDLCAHALKCVISGAGNELVLAPVFEAIEVAPGWCEIGLEALRKVIDDESSGGIAHDSMLSKIESFLQSFPEPRKIRSRLAFKGEQDQTTTCRFMIQAVQKPRRPNYDLVRENIGHFPTLFSLFDEKWISDQKRHCRAHPLLLVLGQKLSSTKILGLIEREKSADAEERSQIARQWRRISRDWNFLYDLDCGLRALKAEHGVGRYARRLKNESDFFSTVSEIDFVLQFLGQCEISLEPKVGPKNLDVRLEIGGRSVYVEIFNPEMFRELKFPGILSLPRRINWMIYNKYEKQLINLDGKDHLAILAIDAARSEANCNFVEDYLQGQWITRLRVSRQGDVYDRRVERDVTETMHELDPRTDTISAVVCYKEHVRNDGSRGVEYKIIPNPRARVKLRASEVAFMEKCLGGARARCPAGPPDHGSRSGAG